MKQRCHTWLRQNLSQEERQVQEGPAAAPATIVPTYSSCPAKSAIWPAVPSPADPVSGPATDHLQLQDPVRSPAAADTGHSCWLA